MVYPSYFCKAEILTNIDLFEFTQKTNIVYTAFQVRITELSKSGDATKPCEIGFTKQKAEDLSLSLCLFTWLFLFPKFVNIAPFFCVRVFYIVYRSFLTRLKDDDCYHLDCESTLYKGKSQLKDSALNVTHKIGDTLRYGVSTMSHMQTQNHTHTNKHTMPYKHTYTV